MALNALIQGRVYCTRYCDEDLDCPVGWTCGDAIPTALTIETQFIDQVCVQGDAE